jgi:hypothetical protein
VQGDARTRKEELEKGYEELGVADSKKCLKFLMPHLTCAFLNHDRAPIVQTIHLKRLSCRLLSSMYQSTQIQNFSLSGDLSAMDECLTI